MVTCKRRSSTSFLSLPRYSGGGSGWGLSLPLSSPQLRLNAPTRERKTPMPVDDILLDCEEHMEKAVEHLQHELRGLRTGRASPALVEDIRVDYYGTPTPLKSIASIAVPEATQLLIRPFSPNDIKAIEKAISDSKLGLTPHSDGRALYLKLPPLSQERRLQLVGQCKQH